MHLVLIGIGTGNPEHMTVQGIRELNAADLVLVPRKGAAKDDLAELRREICGRYLENPATRVVEFDLPVRDAGAPYRQGVEDWHRAIAAAYRGLLEAHAGPASRVALLIWGDPSLYDSTLRILGHLQRAWGGVRAFGGAGDHQPAGAGGGAPGGAERHRRARCG